MCLGVGEGNKGSDDLGDMHLELVVFPQRRKQITLIDARPHALKHVEPLRLGREEPESVQLRDESDQFVLGRGGGSRTEGSLAEKVEMPAQDLRARENCPCQHVTSGM